MIFPEPAGVNADEVATFLNVMASDVQLGGAMPRRYKPNDWPVRNAPPGAAGEVEREAVRNL